MQRTSKGDCKAPEIVQGEAIHGWRFIPVGSCPQGTLIGEFFLVLYWEQVDLPCDDSCGRTSRLWVGRRQYIWYW